MPARALVLLLTAALALTGCGAGKKAPSDEDQVRTTVLAFGRASAHKDYVTLCQQILSPSLVAAVRDRGIPCELALKHFLGGVRAPRVTVVKVTVKGKRAQAVTRSQAAGQPPSRDVVKLVKTGDGWRIDNLG
jgi:hypothetical protein